MFPSLAAIRETCDVSPLEERLLLSPEAPIVLLRRRTTPLAARPRGGGLAPSLAPGNPNLGVMLPYTPLHHLLLSLLGFPVVATSGNHSDEPICTDERDAIDRLGTIADLFLVHNRPILRHVDDSIVRLMGGREMVLRRARGYAPLPAPLPASPRKLPNDRTEAVVLAVGGHLKNAVALAVGGQAFLSQHIGDLETEAAFEAFRRVITDLERLHEAPPDMVAADGHPDYLSTRFARELATGPAAPRLVEVQHHAAHVLACIAENELTIPALGVSWDGTGYGLDGTIWGGEFFLVTDCQCERVAHFRPFPLPGGDKAVKEPRRTALGLLFAMEGESAFSREELPSLRAFSRAELVPLQTMLRRRLNCPLTSSTGRLFDAVASLLGLRQETRFEGQAAMELEFALEAPETAGHYPFAWMEPAPPAAAARAGAVRTAALDWQPLVEALLADRRAGMATGVMAARFHNALAEVIVAAALRFKQERVALSGGCFQNCYLTERAIRRLREAGFRPYWHQRVPPNDGGIALGQVVAARRMS
jgi:hydrogenase maturation protein HypF